MNNEEKVLKKTSQTVGDYTIVENDYNSKVAEIVNKINDSVYSNRQKLYEIYKYLVNNCKIELGVMGNRGLRNVIYYPYKGKKVSGGEKYAPVLIGKGVCKGFCVAFKDIAEKCGVQTEIIDGMHLGEKHSWLVYLDDGRLKHIDIYDGICNKGLGKNIDEYFLLTDWELRMKRRHSNFAFSAINAEKNLRLRIERRNKSRK